jgi:hypothetical protein
MQERRPVSKGVLAAAIVVVLAAAFFGVRAFVSYRSRQARGAVSAAVATAARAEKALAPTDALGKSAFKDWAKIDVKGGLAEIDAAQKEVAAAKSRLDSAVGGLSGSEKSLGEKTGQLLTLEMTALTDAGRVLEAAGQGQAALGPSKEGWAALRHAADLLDLAKSEFEKGTRTSVGDSGVVARQAGREAAAAKVAYEKATKAFPEGLFKPYLSYETQMSDRSDFTTRAAEAWLGGNVAKANSLIAQADSRAAAAKKLAPSMPAPQATSPITDGIRLSDSQYVADYLFARAKASVLGREIRLTVKE